MIVSVGLLYYCIIYTGYISTLDWDGAAPLRESVGLANYARMVQRSGVLAVPRPHRGVLRGDLRGAGGARASSSPACCTRSCTSRRLYKVLIFIPVVLATATTAPVFRQIYAPDGTLNTVLRAVGLDALAQPWLANGTIALIIVIIGRRSGSPPASSSSSTTPRWARSSTRSSRRPASTAPETSGSSLAIVWPGVRGTTLAIAILSAIGSLKTFDIPFLITGGGPSYATEFLGTQIYRVSVAFSEVGYGAALSIVLLVLAIGAAIIINTGGQREEVSDV